jgi:hypothetical protein
VKSASMQKLLSLNLSAEQWTGVMAVLAEELAPLEAVAEERLTRLAKDRQRKIHGKSMDIYPPEIRGNSVEIPSRAGAVVINNSQTLEKVDRLVKTPIPPSPLSSKPLSDPEGFTDFWTIYPKRDGSADRKGAVKAFRAALKRTDLQTILDGAKHYAEAMAHRDKSGTEFVAQARTWLNGDRWNERYDTAVKPSSDFQKTLRSADDAIARFKASGLKKQEAAP